MKENYPYVYLQMNEILITIHHYQAVNMFFLCRTYRLFELVCVWFVSVDSLKWILEEQFVSLPHGLHSSQSGLQFGA